MGLDKPSPPCPLCTAESAFFHRDSHRPYHQCTRCRLIHVPSSHHPSVQEEKAQYDLHENTPQDTGYRQFLSRLATPLLQKLPPHSQGLDYGCGPGPTLSVMLEEADHVMALHDPIYHPNSTALSQSYDFITATEVFEHLHHPARDLEIIYRALKPNGWLGIMTKRAQDPAAFAQWHYIQDPTHVCFWTQQTFHWLANQWQTKAQFPAADVVLMQKK
ncbi:MAG: hypothetical protein CMO66_00010 [Verrucomicrobiales bacterium]|nr:hypothetical protein [Verrucomicrobiales bacterium]